MTKSQRLRSLVYKDDSCLHQEEQVCYCCQNLSFLLYKEFLIFCPQRCIYYFLL